MSVIFVDAAVSGDQFVFAGFGYEVSEPFAEFIG
jgi:hypothetical protein